MSGRTLPLRRKNRAHTDFLAVVESAEADFQRHQATDQFNLKIVARGRACFKGARPAGVT